MDRVLEKNLRAIERYIRRYGRENWDKRCTRRLEELLKDNQEVFQRLKYR